ncbi:helix-turn-helix transcriptional regulator [Pectinatus frisingensis]|uniref:helix-turn-helix transcriptional regulator n=1 Tax=Pectinatus frisingensis TaxID=865 RepID=UPI0018C5CBCD|nr:helix-turn-helix transcriptional regulator [Pectinatus frisingensis]
MKISLKAARVNANMNQKEVAKQLKISNCTLVRWEKGNHKIDINSFHDLCNLYKVKPDDIFLGSK